MHRSQPLKDKPSTGHIVMPYVQGLGEVSKTSATSMEYKHILRGTTIKQLLIRPKDQDPKERESNVIYSYQCAEVDCDEEYIGKPLEP